MLKEQIKLIFDQFDHGDYVPAITLTIVAVISAYLLIKIWKKIKTVIL